MEERIVVPEAGPPRQNQNKNSEIESHCNPKEEFQTPEPHRRGLLELGQGTKFRLGLAARSF